MKIIKFFLISLISTVLNIEILLADTKKGTKFVLLGHLYPLIKNHEGGLLKLAEKVNSHNPDYIFILGEFILSMSFKVSSSDSPTATTNSSQIGKMEVMDSTTG